MMNSISILEDWEERLLDVKDASTLKERQSWVKLIKDLLQAQREAVIKEFIHNLTFGEFQVYRPSRSDATNNEARQDLEIIVRKNLEYKPNQNNND